MCILGREYGLLILTHTDLVDHSSDSDEPVRCRVPDREKKAWKLPTGKLMVDSYLDSYCGYTNPCERLIARDYCPQAWRSRDEVLQNLEERLRKICEKLPPKQPWWARLPQ
jgi:hypothetical protein